MHQFCIGHSYFFLTSLQQSVHLDFSTTQEDKRNVTESHKVLPKNCVTFNMGCSVGLIEMWHSSSV